MFSGQGKLGHGTSSRASNRTSSMIADAGLKKSATVGIHGVVFLKKCFSTMAND